MYPLTRLILVLALAPLLPAQVGAPDRGQSKYWELPADTMIPTRTVLRQETVTLSQPAHVLVQSDGALKPTGWPTSTQAWIQIKINGAPASNTSYMDWHRSVAPRIHSYNTLCAPLLPAGTHTIELEAHTQDGTVMVTAKSNLCIFVNPAEKVVQARSTQDTPPVQSTLPTGQGPERCTWTQLDYHPVVQLQIPEPEVPIFTFASAHVYDIASAGDMMLGIFPDHPIHTAEPQLHYQATFSVQDVWTVSEFQSPIYSHFLLRSPSANSNSILTFPNNICRSVCYYLGSFKQFE